MILLYINKLFAKPLITFHRSSSLPCWANNRVYYPSLAKLASSNSVPSERLFYGAGDIYDEKRNRLGPEKAETLALHCELNNKLKFAAFF